MTKKRQPETSTYTPAPSVPEEIAERYVVVSAAMSGAMTVSEAARRLQLSRNHFQTLMHRAQTAVLEAITPGLPGRPPKSDREKELEVELKRLQRESARLEHELSLSAKMLGAVSDLMHQRSTSRATSRQAKTKTKSTSSSTSTPATTPDPPGEEPDGDLRKVTLEWAEALAREHATLQVAARAVGVSATTVSRWRRRVRRGEPLACRRGPSTHSPPEVARSVVEREVRATRGLVGAAALARATGTSRRFAATVKAETRTAMERERQSACERITINEPGVLRGFDQKWMPTTEGLKPVLVCADGAIPYRTHIVLADAYNESEVLHALEEDFEANGAPLVLRLDRARVHRTPRVDGLLRRHRVLRLHGPPRMPRYYGQLERQNREHEAWVAAGELLTPRELARDLTRMRVALNDRWHRRTLQWRTAAEVWRARAPLDVDRYALALEVDRRAECILTARPTRTVDEDVARRFAIEHALESRGLLRRRGGTECLVV